jgi:hypothetical protein
VYVLVEKDLITFNLKIRTENSAEDISDFTVINISMIVS